MFASPGDGREPEYSVALLLAYEWPLLLAGSAAFVLFAVRLRKGSGALSSFQPGFSLVWALMAVVALALSTRREAGQLLCLLLPLAFLGGSLVEELFSDIEWHTARRWLSVGVGALAAAGCVALSMTEWSSGRAGSREQVLLGAALTVLAGLLALPVVARGKDGIFVSGAAAGLLAFAFLLHSSLAVVFADGTELSNDERLLGSAEQLRDSLDTLAEQREGEIVVDGSLLDELGWTLRDSDVVFGDALTGSGALVLPAGETPSGFAPLGDVWRIAEGWYPESILRPRSMWRWLLYRQPYSALKSIDVMIYVPTV